MIFITNRLNTEVESKILLRKYSEEQLAEMRYHIKEENLKNRKKFITASILTGVLYIAFAVFAIMNSAEFVQTLAEFSACAFLLALGLIFGKIFAVDGVKNQFIQAVQTGYPELAENFGKDSFKK